jgi:hypothetical protein
LAAAQLAALKAGPGRRSRPWDFLFEILIVKMIF